jgi:hypothetical protein
VALCNCALLALINGVLITTNPSYVLSTVIKGVTLNLGCLMTIILLFVPKWLQIRSSKNGDEPPVATATLDSGSHHSTVVAKTGELQLPGAARAKQQQQKLPSAQLYMVKQSNKTGLSGAEGAVAELDGFSTHTGERTLQMGRVSLAQSSPGASPPRSSGVSPAFFAATSPAALGPSADVQRHASMKATSPSAWKERGGRASPERSPRSL